MACIRFHVEMGIKREGRRPRRGRYAGSGTSSWGRSPVPLMEHASRAQVQHGVAGHVAEVGVHELDVGEVAVGLDPGDLLRAEPVHRLAVARPVQGQSVALVGAVPARPEGGPEGEQPPSSRHGAAGVPVDLARGPARGVDQLQPGRDLQVLAPGGAVVAGDGELAVPQPERGTRWAGDDLGLGRRGPPAREALQRRLRAPEAIVGDLEAGHLGLGHRSAVTRNDVDAPAGGVGGDPGHRLFHPRSRSVGVVELSEAGVDLGERHRAQAGVGVRDHQPRPADRVRGVASMASPCGRRA